MRLPSRALFGLLLRSPGPLPERPAAQIDRGRELLLVVGSALLRQVGKGPIGQIGHHQTQNGVAEELEAFVGDQPALLEGERPVRQCGHAEQPVGEAHAEGPLEWGGVLGHVRLPGCATRRRWPGGRRRSRSSRTPGAGASAGGTAGTPRRSVACPSTGPPANGSSTCCSCSSASAFLSLLLRGASR